MPTLRVVLDTSVPVSSIAYARSTPGKSVGAWRQGSMELIVPRYILDELGRVLPRLDRRLDWKPHEFDEYVEMLSFLANVVEPETVAPGTVRDDGDLPILGTLLAAKADYLITGDDDLLALADRYSIVTPAEFWRRHGA